MDQRVKVRRIALVTGGMGGLGTAICKQLVDSGHTVVANCLPGYDKKDSWIAELKAQGYEVTGAECDVSNYEACKQMVDHIEATLGSLDILVNNAGITRDSAFHKMGKEQWDAVLSTNLDSVFNVTHHIMPKMAARGWGRIINISSVNGVKGQFGQANYSAAKAGILGMTKALAYEGAKKGVTVNAIAPGYVATEMVMAMRQDIVDGIVGQVPMGRLAKPEEIGALVAYLSSDLAGYMTGATLNINGGLHMC